MKQNKTHYRVLRSSVVLARSSATFRETGTPALAAAMDAAVAVNYQFDQIPNQQLEILFATFDDEYTKRVRAEFVFRPEVGSVRVHDACVATCDLCGKGDSKETRDNKDHLRFEFRLSNVAGGEDKWCGATCIRNYGLRVDGAATAEEASRLLDQTMRSAMRAYVVAVWRNDNPDHEKIPDQYQDYRSQFYQAQRTYAQKFPSLLLLGVDDKFLGWPSPGTLRTASNFYLREGYLTDKKTPAWVRAKECLATLGRVLPILDKASSMESVADRVDFLRASAAEVSL